MAKHTKEYHKEPLNLKKSLKR